MSAAIADVIAAYQGSSGEATKALLARLEQLGELGVVAAYLYRAQKASERAKVYRVGGFRQMAYDRKDWALRELVAALQGAPGAGIVWGWGVDDKQPYHKQVLYIDLPTGQVSFHTGARGEGPDYAKGWDGRPGQSPDRIVRWLARLLDAA